MDEVGLGKRLQAARRQAGFTQQQLCVQANLSYSTLAKIERGAIKSPSVFTIQSIAHALNTNLDSLLGTLVNQPTSAAPKRVSRSGVRFVYFDMNDCLVRFHTAAFTQLARDSNQPVDVVESVFWKYNEPVNRGEVSLDQLNTVWARRLGIMVDWRRYYMDAVDAMPGMRELVTEVAKHYQVGILSNTAPGFIKELIDTDVLPPVHFDMIIDSSEVHAIKPENDIYEIAAARASVAPHELLLIDDSRPNLVTAESLGWHSLWFDAYQPDESAMSIREALDI